MLTLILIILSGLSKAVTDKLQFHYSESIFSRFDNQQWWNPAISWKNKWKNGDSKYGERFFLSSTILVFVTDAWHFFQAIKHVFYFTAIVLYVPIFKFAIIDFVLLYVVHNIVFEFTFSKLLKLND
jgi:hypothetical protein